MAPSLSRFPPLSWRMSSFHTVILLYAGTSFDGEVRNLVQGESGGDGSIDAVLDGDQSALGARNAFFVCTAPVGGAAIAAASVSGASASSSRDRGGDVFCRKHGVARDC